MDNYKKEKKDECVERTDRLPSKPEPIDIKKIIETAKKAAFVIERMENNGLAS